MLAALGKFILPAQEREVFDKISPYLEKFGGGVSLDMNDVLAQVQGELPRHGPLGKALDFLQSISSNEHWDTLCSMFVDHLSTKGVSPVGMSGLLQRLVKSSKLDFTPSGNPNKDIADMLRMLSVDRNLAYAPVVGAMCTCPECHYTYLV